MIRDRAPIYKDIYVIKRFFTKGLPDMQSLDHWTPQEDNRTGCTLICASEPLAWFLQRWKDIDPQMFGYGWQSVKTCSPPYRQNVELLF